MHYTRLAIRDIQLQNCLMYKLEIVVPTFLLLQKSGDGAPMGFVMTQSVDLQAALTSDQHADLARTGFYHDDSSPQQGRRAQGRFMASAVAGPLELRGAI